MLDVRHVCAGYDGKMVVKDVSFCLRPGEVLGLLGPNGVGKTTLFKTILGFLPKQGGEIFMGGMPMVHSDRKRLAKYIGYVPQAHEPPFPFQVLDVVVMGGIVRASLFHGPSAKERKRALEILEQLDILYLKDSVYTEISGGERQMVLIARALMQEPQYLMMDEPTSNLDFGNQMRVLEQVNQLAQQGKGIIMTTHFPDHAFLCCSKAAIMSKGSPFLMGNVSEVVTERHLLEAYGTRIKIAQVEAKEVEEGQVTTCIPLLHPKEDR